MAVQPVDQKPVNGIAFLTGMPIVSFLSLAYRRLIQDHESAALLRSTRLFLIVGMSGPA
jgi:hypothetical protein